MGSLFGRLRNERSQGNPECLSQPIQVSALPIGQRQCATSLQVAQPSKGKPRLLSQRGLGKTLPLSEAAQMHAQRL